MIIRPTEEVKVGHGVFDRAPAERAEVALVALIAARLWRGPVCPLAAEKKGSVLKDGVRKCHGPTPKGGEETLFEAVVVAYEKARRGALGRVLQRMDVAEKSHVSGGLASRMDRQTSWHWHMGVDCWNLPAVSPGCNCRPFARGYRAKEVAVE